MKRSKKNIERNKLDYLLTDIMPVEVSELFSFSKFYEYLLSKQSTLDDIVSKMRAMKAENSETPFAGGKWGNWATSPLKFNILKGTDSIRGLNLVQPLSAMNIYFFVECYQKELLDILSNNSCFSLRYHRKNSDLFYRRKSKKIVDYFEKTSQKVDRAILQQTGAYFKIYKFNSVSSFTNSRLWQQCNFKYHNFAKIDYKSCFDSIYTHAYKWCIEKDTVDSKEASNANLHIVIDRVLQNINGRSSNGLIVGPEFSRMIAEVLLQEIDVEVMLNGALAKYLTDEAAAADLAQALKIAINSVYGLTSASFDHPFRDNRNKDNIVAKRGALFMVNLKHEVQRRGFTVAHIKTDSIKIPDATPEIIQFVMDYGKQYGYNFEHEATYDRMCLVNDAVYIAKYKDGKHAGEWTATGTQFQVPYVFKKLFSKEPIEFEDMCETKSVTSALYLDMNEGLPDVSELEKELERIVKRAKEFGVTMDLSGNSGDAELDPLVKEIW